MLLQVHADGDQASFSLKWRMKHMVYKKPFFPYFFFLVSQAPHILYFRLGKGKGDRLTGGKYSQQASELWQLAKAVTQPLQKLY